MSQMHIQTKTDMKRKVSSYSLKTGSEMFGERHSTGRLFHTAHVVSLDDFTAVSPNQLLACSSQALVNEQQRSNH